MNILLKINGKLLRINNNLLRLSDIIPGPPVELNVILDDNSEYLLDDDNEILIYD